jgi:ribosomal protein S18 acetylase RimI-like enzyme
MTYDVRFGILEDLHEVSSSWDRFVPKHILEWKLQNHEIILAVENQTVVGYLRLEYLWTSYPYIGLITVDPAHRKQGIGRTLLSFLEEYLISNDIRFLYSSSQVNEAEPQDWHRHLGFVECGIINGINPGNIGEVFFVKRF